MKILNETKLEENRTAGTNASVKILQDAIKKSMKGPHVNPKTLRDYMLGLVEGLSEAFSDFPSFQPEVLKSPEDGTAIQGLGLALDTAFEELTKVKV